MKWEKTRRNSFLKVWVHWPSLPAEFHADIMSMPGHEPRATLPRGSEAPTSPNSFLSFLAGLTLLAWIVELSLGKGLARAGPGSDFYFHHFITPMIYHARGQGGGGHGRGGSLSHRYWQMRGPDLSCLGGIGSSGGRWRRMFQYFAPSPLSAGISSIGSHLFSSRRLRYS